MCDVIKQSNVLVIFDNIRKHEKSFYQEVCCTISALNNFKYIKNVFPFIFLPRFGEILLFSPTAINILLDISQFL